MIIAAPFVAPYPWTPVLIVILMLLVLSMVRVSGRQKPVDKALPLHQQYHTGADAPRFPEFCSYCRDEVGR